MNKINNTLSLLLGLLLLCGGVRAEVSLNAARVAAVDVLETGEFYKAALGLREVNRLDLPGGNVELMLNFGASDAEAKANPNAQVVIMHRESDAVEDPVAHLIFTVTDIQATAAAVREAGGKTVREPFEFGNSGIWIAMFTDPAGNQIELLQQP